MKTSSTAAARPRPFRKLLLCRAAAVLWALSATVNAGPGPPPSPPPDDYPPTTVQLSGNTTVTPESTATPPPGTARINVSTSIDFKGQLEADHKTGVVRVTNAHPGGKLGERYEITVTEYDSANAVIATKYFVLLVETPATCNPVTFARTNFPAGTNPRSIAVGDFNGDSIQDLAIASAPDKVFVLLGKTSGGFVFSDPVGFSVGDTPNSVTVGDFDGDGKQDVATVNSGSRSVSVLLGNGDGTFKPASPRDILVGVLPRSIKVGDFNSDYKQDLVVTNEFESYVSVLLGDGLGGFTAGHDFEVGSFPYAVALGDFNEDGRTDLAVTRRTPANTVSVLFNTTPPDSIPGIVTFDPAIPFGVGDDPTSVAVGSFNVDLLDYVPDLVTANDASQDVSVLLGNPNPPGGFGSAVSFLAGAAPRSVAVGDFDGNARQDLAVANEGSLSVLLGDGAGSFTLPKSFSAGLNPDNPDSLVVGDFNGDGMQDLAVANYDLNEVAIFLRQCGCPPVITHSTSQTIMADNSISCNLGGPPGSFHTDNSYWRAFDMEMFAGSQQFNVTSVSFGIETATAGGGATEQPVMVNLYAQTSGTFPGGTRTSILPTAIAVMVPNQTQTILNVPVETTVPAGTSELIMEVFTPNGQADHNSFFVGSNTAPETGPSYISAASCGIPMPTTTADLGFPNMHVVFNINGGCAGGTPTPTPTPGTQAVNLSTRLRVQTGDNVGIGGFIITGTAPKHVLLRGIGPSLTQFGVPDVLADPVLELHGPGAFATITNNNWRDTQEAEIQATGIPPTNDLESAIVAALAPGAYSAILSGNGNTSGVALIEFYDLDQGVASKLANISTRALVSTGANIVIAGFSLSNGNGVDDRLVVRGIGPSLIALGIPNALADPTLELRDVNGALLVADNDWQDNPEQAAELMASGLAPGNNLEAGMAATLPPGLYTALLAGLNDGTGVGLVEVYDIGSP